MLVGLWILSVPIMHVNWAVLVRAVDSFAPLFACHRVCYRICFESSRKVCPDIAMGHTETYKSQTTTRIYFCNHYGSVDYYGLLAAIRHEAGGKSETTSATEQLKGKLQAAAHFERGKRYESNESLCRATWQENLQEVSWQLDWLSRAEPKSESVKAQMPRSAKMFSHRSVPWPLKPNHAKSFYWANCHQQRNSKC